MKEMTSVLKLRDVSKSFGAVRALERVSLEMAAGEVHALVGENGAGKSTLIKIITGAYQPDSGEVEIAGQHITDFDPLVAKELGVAVVYQQPTLFPDLSIAENLALGVESPSAWRWINWNARRKQARDLLTRVGAELSPDAEAGSLSMPQQQLVEIARALGQNARLLIMDEPTASLSSREVEHLFRVIHQLRAAGVAILYVSHRLEELSEIADRVTVLRDGAWIATRPMEGMQPSELVRAMVGREVAAIFPKRVVPLGDERLSVQGLSSHAAGIQNIYLSVRAGEILGIGGLMGAGRTELAQVLFGLHPAESGEIFIDGQKVVIDSPTAAIRHGIAYVPEDRRVHGVIPEMSVAANTTLALLEAKRSTRIASSSGWLDFQAEQSLAEQMVTQLHIKTASVASPVETLSGGNQQKVALARWLAIQPRVLILDEPTQGIDVGAKSEIHRLMVDLAAKGLAIIAISSELPELLGMCDRIAVMRSGTISGLLSREEATAERIMTLALP